MLGVVLTALVSFISTNIDDIFILMLFFSQVGDKLKKSHIIIGQYLGIITLIVVSILGSIGLNLIPQQYMGLLGIIPIFLGVKEWINYRKSKKDSIDSLNDVEINNLIVEEDMIGDLINPAIINVFLVTISNGADNIGVYIPLFTSMDLFELIITVIIFLVLIGVWCLVGERLANIPTIKKTIESYKNILVPIVFIVIGIYIIVTNGLFK